MDEADRVQINVRIGAELAAKLDKRIDELERERGGGAKPSRSEVVRMALIAYLERGLAKGR
jgi:metal-responsive CopG/Arc/MetJ family transcriptional regulator